MIRIISFVLFSVLCFNVQSAFAVKEKVQPKSPIFQQSEDDFDFEKDSYYISDEQLEEAKNIEKIDENTSWLQKIINSSHFSSNTATKTYIPINKVQE